MAFVLRNHGHLPLHKIFVNDDYNKMLKRHFSVFFLWSWPQWFRKNKMFQEASQSKGKSWSPVTRCDKTYSARIIDNPPPNHKSRCWWDKEGTYFQGTEKGIFVPLTEWEKNLQRACFLGFHGVLSLSVEIWRQSRDTLPLL